VDFALDETERAIAELAGDVLERTTASSWKDTWSAMASAGLTSLVVPDRLGGDGLGVLAAAVLLTEVGRCAAEVPALATLMLGALPVARWGTADQQEQLLSGVGSGEVLLTAALREPSAVWPVAPATVAVRDGIGAGTVSGTKVGVPYAAEAAWMLVPAAIGAEGQAVVVVEPASAGVTITPTPASAGGPEYTVRLDRAPIAAVLGAGDAVQDLYHLAAAGAAAMADGAVAGALALTTTYIAIREQFGRPLATFQAVAQQIADIYITSRTLHLAAVAAAWQLSRGPAPAGDADVAAFWLAAQAPAALRACHHLHGGVGMDSSYPLAAFSSLVGDLTRMVGGAEHGLDVLAGAACSST
jgi:alkylation response protein AidB-like acyl-CoA dehydrogenase